MSRYLLQDLIFVREHREDKASKAVTVARRLVLEAEQNLKEREEELKTYHVWRLEEEERKIQSLMMKPVKLGDITDMRLEISSMRERELAYQDLVHKAEGELDRAKVALEQARLAHRKTQQDLEKLVEHRKIWSREQDLENERLADLELEDFSPAKGDRFMNMEDTNYELN